MYVCMYVCIGFRWGMYVCILFKMVLLDDAAMLGYIMQSRKATYVRTYAMH